MKLLVALLLFFAITTAKNAEKTSKSMASKGILPSPNCTCGYRGTSSKKPRERIVGGIDAKPNEYPFIAAMQYDLHPGFIHCGSTIITEWHALSAAHCNPGPLRRASLILGAHEVDDIQGPQTVTVPIKKFIDHEDYNMGGFSENDITLILLSRPLTFGPTIAPVCFPKPGLNILNAKVKVLGWGVTKDEGEQPLVLQQAFVEVQPISACVEEYEQITDNVLCTYSPGSDPCQGDSGGPVLHYDPAIQRYTLVGIISFGKVCGQAGVPSVNANVIAFREWVLQKIAETEPSAATCQKN